MTTQDYRQFSSDSSLHNKKTRRRDLHHLTESNCQDSPDRVVRRRTHEFSKCSRPLHTLLGLNPVYSDTNSLVVESANSFTYIPRERSRYTTREFQVSNLIGNKGKNQVSQPAAYFPRVRCTTRDTGCLPIDSFLHWTPSTVNLEMKHRERTHVFE